MLASVRNILLTFRTSCRNIRRQRFHSPLSRKSLYGGTFWFCLKWWVVVWLVLDSFWHSTWSTCWPHQSFALHVTIYRGITCVLGHNLFLSTFPFNCSLHSVLYDVTLGPLTPVIKPIKFRTLFLDLCHSLCTSEASLCEVNLLLCEHVLHGSCDYLDLN